MSYTTEEIREAGLDRFDVFLCELWAHLGLPAPTPVQLDIARYLQYGPRRRGVQAFRGIGKSWITVGYVCWRLFKNPEEKIMVVSAGGDLAADFTRFCLQLIRGMPLLQHLQPQDDDRSSTEKFDVGPAEPSKDPSLKSVGINGQLTGSRADLIISDDIEIPKNSYTHHLRGQLAERVKEFDAVLKPDGEVVVLGTPQAEDTVYRKLAERGYEFRVWPAEVPSSTEQYGERLGHYIQKLIAAGVPVGAAVEPSRFPEDDLAERRLSYAAGYALQFMLDTSLSDAEKHPLKVKNLIVDAVDAERGHGKLVWMPDRERVIEDLSCGGLEGDRYVYPAWRSPEMYPWQMRVMTIDPSGRGKDETAYSVTNFLHSQIFLAANGGFLDGFGEKTLSELAGIAIRHRVNYLLIEENYGGGMFTNLLKPILIALAQKVQRETEERAWAPIINPEEWNGWSRGQKEVRICDVLEPVINSHRLIIDRRVVEKDLQQQAKNQAYSLIYQMSRITRDRGSLEHDDRLESLSMACDYYASMMDRDRDKVIVKRTEADMKEEIRRFKANAMHPGVMAPKRPLRWGVRGGR